MTIILAVCLLALSVWSLFLGVLDLSLVNILNGDFEQIEILMVSRLPRLLAILYTGVGMSVAGLPFFPSFCGREKLGIDF